MHNNLSWTYFTKKMEQTWNDTSLFTPIKWYWWKKQPHLNRHDKCYFVKHVLLRTYEGSDITHKLFINVRDNEKIPYEIGKHIVIRLDIIRVWKCFAMVVTLEPKKKEDGPKTIDVILLGYFEQLNNRNHRCNIIQKYLDN